MAERIERVKGLNWARGWDRGRGRTFCHGHVVTWIRLIAGGEREQYRARASRMISEAKALGQIAPISPASRYYTFLSKKGE